MKFLWATLSVSNFEASLDFWTKIVGLPLQRTMTPPGMKIAFLGQGETQVELIWDSRKEKIPVTKDFSLGFEVKDVDLAIKELQSQGVEIHGPFAPNPAIRFFYISDPDGWQVQFVQSA